jgi:hypothetical protein
VHTPALHVCPTIAQFSHGWPGAPHDISKVPVWHVPLVSQQPVHVPPSTQVPLAPPALLPPPPLLPPPLLADPESPRPVFVVVELPHATTMRPKVTQQASRMARCSFPR